MKSKIKPLKLVFIAIISSSFLFNSCSLIGFGIGAAIDSQTPKTSNIYKNQIDTLEIGNKVEITLFDGKKKYGKFDGIVDVYDHDFHWEYNITLNPQSNQRKYF
jgi:1-aminocyclopropane-1-carboxylate deaminase/D-cysteine desulfhydrase-like pyridoxal-dependent ACC family enzyme